MSPVLWIMSLLLLPFIVYVSVKVGTYGFYKGRESFYKETTKNGTKEIKQTGEGVGKEKGRDPQDGL